jgi:hypothetical protein
MVHRGDAYFERCYAADFDARVRATDRHTCWVAWLDHYTVGQPAERIRYARARAAAIGAEGAAATLPGLPSAAVEGAYRPSVLVSTSELPAPGAETATAPPSVATGRAARPGGAFGPAPASAPRALGPSGAARETFAGSVAPPPPPPRQIRRLNAACATVCEPRVRRCLEQCDPAGPRGCRYACESEYRSCARACY